jgi:hypothetical protein
MWSFLTKVYQNGDGAAIFWISLSIVWMIERVGVAWVNRNKPGCDCDCHKED